MARMRHPSVEAVEQALYDRPDGGPAPRDAPHAVGGDARDVRLMHAAATRKLVGPEHRRTAKLLADGGIEDPEAWLADAREQVLAAFHEHGPMSRATLGDPVPALQVPIVLAAGKHYATTISAHTRVLLKLGFEGEIVRTRPTGTWINGAYTYAAVDTWLDGGLGDLDEQEAARRPGAARGCRRSARPRSTDLQWWMGWTVAPTKHALAGCRAEAVDLDGVAGWVASRRRGARSSRSEPWVALLPGLDPTTMGWKERAWYLARRLRGRLRPDGQRRPDDLGRRTGGRRLGAGPRRRDPLALLPRRAGRRRKAVDAEVRAAARPARRRPGSRCGSPATSRNVCSTDFGSCVRRLWG